MCIRDRHVAETGRPHVIEDISRDSRFLNRTRTRKSGEKVAFICVPIIHLQQVIGTLSIDRAVDRDTDLELSLIHIYKELLKQQQSRK